MVAAGFGRRIFPTTTAADSRDHRSLRPPLRDSMWPPRRWSAPTSAAAPALSPTITDSEFAASYACGRTAKLTLSPPFHSLNLSVRSLLA